MNKGGQFFLMAALIIAGVIIGLTSIVNYTHAPAERTQFYDLGKEIGFEARQVLDYGTYSGSDTEQLLETFIANYSSYISQDQVVFIYGNSTSIIAFYFNQTLVGSVGIDLGGDNPNIIPITLPQGGQTQVQPDDEGNIIVTINGISYEFNLRAGQNFYFVLVKEEDEDRFVTTG